MNQTKLSRLCLLVMAIALPAWTATADQQLQQRASWQQPTVAEVRLRVNEYLSGLDSLDEATQIQIDALWPEEAGEMTGDQLQQNVAATLAVVSPEARQVVNFCRENRRRFELPQFDVLSDEEASPFLRSNLRMIYGRWLAQQELYDEAQLTLEGLQPRDVADPASLLFYQSVANHRLLKKDECLQQIEQLLEQEAAIPNRYASVAKLMEADLAPLKVDSLDEIARLMDAIRLELDHARAGTRVRQRQEEVLAKLDKMIEELEKQRQQQQSSSSSNSPSSPAQDSTPAGGVQGAGKVDQKDIGDTDGWGNLPPKRREKLMQQIFKDSPSHFREVWEAYSRKLARDNEN